LPLPSGLIGTAEPVAFDYQSCRPCFPFLSLAQLALILTVFAVIVGVGALFVPRGALPFIAIGSLIGMLPSIWWASPSRVTVRTPRPIPWAEFTREWVMTHKYRQKENDPNVWLSDMPIWIRWPGETLRLHIGEDMLEVRGTRRLMRQLKRNFDRISARGHPYS
jgi:hypothetical protein